MKLSFELKLPYHFGEIVNEYLKTLQFNTKYNAYTLSDKLEVVECVGIIQSDGSWNYHNNYDDSELQLAIITAPNTFLGKWFTLNESEVEKVQRENIERWKEVLNNELLRLQSLK